MKRFYISVYVFGSHFMRGVALCLGIRNYNSCCSIFIIFFCYYTYRKIVLIGSRCRGSVFFGGRLQGLLRHLSGKNVPRRIRGPFAMIYYIGRGRRPAWVKVLTGRRKIKLKSSIRLPKYNRRKLCKRKV